MTGEKRIALLTGASGGIGRAAAAAFRREGWQVIGTDQNSPGEDVALDRFVKEDLADPKAHVHAIADATAGFLVNALRQEE